MKPFTADSPWPDFGFWHTEATASTMNDARELSRSGVKNGCVMADYQSAGRGRLDGRVWLSETASSLLTTIWTEAGDELASAAPLVTGAALLCALQDVLAENGRIPVASAADQQGFRIKWPNDILWNKQKLAGILCERSGTTIMAGIGLNLGQSDFPGDYRTRPVSFLQAFGFVPERKRILECILSRLWRFYSKMDDWHTVVSAHLAFKNLPVTFNPGIAEHGDASLGGILRGLDRSGALLIQTASGTETFYSGEISPANTLSGG